MYEPVFRITNMLGGSYTIDVGDCDSVYLPGLWAPHFSVLISPFSGAVVFMNHHTDETITFYGSSVVSRMYGIGQYSYDVLYKRKRKEKVKIGTMLSRTGNEDYKQFLTKPLLRAAEEIEKKYGKDWLTF